jgi:ribosomal protein S18 acetylase RimI-like enzyme
MQELFQMLQNKTVVGVHLGMHPDNQQALSFFKKMGFIEQEHADLPWEEVLYLGKDLKQEFFKSQ